MTKVELMSMKWFKELCDLVQAAFNKLTEQHEIQIPALEVEKREIESGINGWSQSLAKPQLSANTRMHLEQQLEVALQRQAAIETAIAGRHAASNVFEMTIDPATVAERLNRLSDVLSGTNPSMTNIELAHHIDRIDCFDDGRIVLRTCKLGSLDGAIDLLSESSIKEHARPPQSLSCTPRRLSRRRLESGEAPTPELKARAIWATDPNRFAALGDEWFDECIFQVPKRQSWTEEYAPLVAAQRKRGKTEEQLAEYFGKSLPTIRKSLRIARQTDRDLGALPRRMPRPRWHENKALEVAQLKATGMSTVALARHFGKSDTTIRSALKHAEVLLAEAAAATLMEDAGPA